MKQYLVLSIDPSGATIITKHFTPLGMQTEQMRRLCSGHGAIAVQEIEQAQPEGEQCVRRKQPWQRRPGKSVGGRHV